MLVEARRAAIRGVFDLGPETGGIRCETFVDQHHFIVKDSEFELGIGDDDPALGGIGTAVFVQVDGPLAYLQGNLVAEEGAALAPGNVFVMARIGFRRGCENCLG